MWSASTGFHLSPNPVEHRRCSGVGGMAWGLMVGVHISQVGCALALLSGLVLGLRPGPGGGAWRALSSLSVCGHAAPGSGGRPCLGEGVWGEQRLFTHSPWRVATWCVVALWRTNSLRLPSSGSIREALCGREVGVLPLQLQWVTRVILAPEEYEKKENSNDPFIGWLLIGDGLLPPL